MADYTKTITISDLMLERIANVTARAREMADTVRGFSVEAWQTSDDFGWQLQPQVGDWDSAEAKRIREATGYDAMKAAVAQLARDLVSAAGGNPGEADWLKELEEDLHGRIRHAEEVA